MSLQDRMWLKEKVIGQRDVGKVILITNDGEWLTVPPHALWKKERIPRKKKKEQKKFRDKYKFTWPKNFDRSEINKPPRIPYISMGVRAGKTAMVNQWKKERGIE